MTARHIIEEFKGVDPYKIKCLLLRVDKDIVDELKTIFGETELSVLAVRISFNKTKTNGPKRSERATSGEGA